MASPANSQPRPPQPRAGVDYPPNRVEFDRLFPDDAACFEYLGQLRWPQGFICPRCGTAEAPWKTSRGLLLCPRCRKHASITAGTIFHRTRTPLRSWFLAAWEITSQKYGANALGIQRVLGLGSYQTAWAWLHKFRRAMVRPDRDKLHGVVEVDESYVGGEEAGAPGRGTIKKSIVAIAVERKGKEMGRIRLGHIHDVSAKSLVGFVSDAVDPGSTIQTDGWLGYRGLRARGFAHSVTVLSASPDPAHVLMPAVHRVASLLKRWLMGTLQGGIAQEHLPYYLDEFTFRFNRRRSRARGLLFYRLLQQAVQHQHTPTAQLYKATGRGRRSPK
jgi:transposase-like protein